MKKILTILIISTLFAGELEVDGDLNVSGDIQSPTIVQLQEIIAQLQAEIVELQAEGSVTSKIISYETSLPPDTWIYLSIEEIIGFDLERGSMQFIGYEGDLGVFPIHIRYYASESDGGLSEYASFQEISPTSEGLVGGMNATYYFDSHIDYMGFRYASDVQAFNGTLYYLITAQFPETRSQK